MPTNRRTSLRKRINNILKRLSKKNGGFNTIYQIAIYTFRKFRYLLLFYPLPIDEKLIIFESFIGRSYSDSPKAIYLEMKQDSAFKNFTFVWVFKNPEQFTDKETLRGAILVKRNTVQYFRYLSQAKYWISNSRAHAFVPKKKAQIYLQTWHGIPFKRIGLDIEKVNNANLSVHELRKAYRIEEKKFDFILSPSRFCSDKLISAFGIKNSTKKILELGYPRNDALHNVDQKNIQQIKMELGISLEKKVILYAPTWRDNEHNQIGHTLEPPIDYLQLKQELGKDFVLLVRYHYFVKSRIHADGLLDFLIDVSDHSDVNELLMISDILITDYSSIFFDYAILERPIIFFMYDLHSYMHDLRGFYLSLTELPGPILTDTNEIATIIQTLIQTKMPYIDKEARQDFLKKYCYLDDGWASKRVINRIFK